TTGAGYGGSGAWRGNDRLPAMRPGALTMPRIENLPTHPWPSVTRSTVTAALLVLLGGALLLAWDWLIAWDPLSLTRRAAIRLLGTLLTAYPALVAAALAGVVISGGMAWRAGRGGVSAHSKGFRQPSRAMAARCLLLCGSTVLGLALAEAGAAAWLGWIHRL